MREILEDFTSPDKIFHLSIVMSEDIEIELFRKWVSSFGESYIKSVGVEPYSKNVEIDGKNIKLVLRLCSLEARFFSIVEGVMRNLPLILLYNVSNNKTLNKLLENQFIKNLKQDVPILLVGNKSTLEQNREVSKEQIEMLKEQYNILASMEISLNTGENVEEMFRTTAKILLKECEERKKKKKGRKKRKK
ncbi:MAG: hypothetical protein ACFFA7_01925 [Promethearchaeota archaeon]